MSETEHERIHEQAEREADELERRGDELGEHVEHTRQDWESKKSDVSVPGAQREEEEGGEGDGPPPEADITPGDRD